MAWLSITMMMLTACGGNPSSTALPIDSAHIAPNLSSTEPGTPADSGHQPPAASSVGAVQATAAGLPDKEAAETLVAIHFSKRNSEAGYPLFKGLTIRIDSIGGGADSSWVAALVQGRQRLNQQDSTTRPFQEQIRLKAYRKGNTWETKPLP